MRAQHVEGMSDADAAQWATAGEEGVDEASLVPQTHQFVPLRFEAGGG